MNVTIISGPRNSAKTTTLKKIIEKKDKKYLGYICESSTDKSNFYLRNVYTNQIIKLMQTKKCLHKEKIGKYYIHINAFEKARDRLLDQIKSEKDKDFVVVVDEVGSLELSSSGYNLLLEKLLVLDIDLILCVRDEFVDQVCQKYKFQNFNIINV